MTNSITISLNELRGILAKVLEGRFGHDRDILDITERVIWMEYRGLSGVSLFLDAINDMDPQARPILKDLAANEIELDCQDASMLSFCDIVSDMAIDLTDDEDLAVIQIKNANHTSAIMAALARLGYYGMAGAAWWPGRYNRVHIGVLDDGQGEPFLHSINLPEGISELKNATFIAARHFGDITAKYPQWFSYREEEGMPANEIRLIYERYLDNGFTMELTDYKRLEKLASVILVESSEMSRKGAGA